MLQALDTVHVPLLLLRAEANEDADTIDLTSEGDFAHKPASAIQLRARDDGTGHGSNIIEMVFCGGSAAGKTFTYKVYGWRKENGPARLIASGTGTLGTQAVVSYPSSGAAATNKFWAHILTVMENWIKTVITTDESGNNAIASLVFDFCGHEWLYVEIENASGAGDEAGDVSVYYCYC